MTMEEWMICDRKKRLEFGDVMKMRFERVEQWVV